jgi:hypothetical protein
MVRHEDRIREVPADRGDYQEQDDHRRSLLRSIVAPWVPMIGR